MERSTATAGLRESGLIAADLAERCAATARRVMGRCDDLAACSEHPAQLTRTFCSPAMTDAHRLLRKWMVSAGMSTRLDSVANLIGRFDQSSGNVQAQRVLLFGSHLDTVVNAGRYDGPLGVLMGLGLVELLRDTLTCLPFSIEVIGFCEEEGIRYRTPFIGSRSMAGSFDSALLDRVDQSGISMRSAIESLRQSEVDCVDAVAYERDQVIGYIEPHIEQGPVLEREGLPVGIVEAIAGQTRAAVLFVGCAGHAGTVPMTQRRDALAGAAEWISQVESIGQQTPGAVTTVAHLEVIPNISNVISGFVSLRLDARHKDETVCKRLVGEIIQAGKNISQKRGLEFLVDAQEHYPSVPMDTTLSDSLAAAAADAGIKPMRLTSGAGHDAAIMAEKFPTAMLFLRCREGLSHHPDESVREDDVAVALEVLLWFVCRLATNFTQS